MAPHFLATAHVLRVTSKGDLYRSAKAAARTALVAGHSPTVAACDGRSCACARRTLGRLERATSRRREPRHGQCLRTRQIIERPGQQRARMAMCWAVARMSWRRASHRFSPALASSVGFHGRSASDVTRFAGFSAVNLGRLRGTGARPASLCYAAPSCLSRGQPAQEPRGPFRPWAWQVTATGPARPRGRRSDAHQAPFMPCLRARESAFSARIFRCATSDGQPHPTQGHFCQTHYEPQFSTDHTPRQVTHEPRL
jgi:hypothetical protein